MTASRSIVSLGLFAFLGFRVLPAVADDAAPPPAATPAPAPPSVDPAVPVAAPSSVAPAPVAAVTDGALIGPRRGSLELRLDNYYLPGIAIAGSGYVHFAPKQGNNDDILSVGLGLGYFVSDQFELGGGLGLTNLDGDVKIPSVNVFLRGLAFVAPRAAGFVGAAFQYQVFAPNSGPNQAFMMPGLDAGLEMFLAASWALRVAANYRYVSSHRDANSNLGTPAMDNSAHSLGFSWGIAAYFGG